MHEGAKRPSAYVLHYPLTESWKKFKLKIAALKTEYGTPKPDKEVRRMRAILDFFRQRMTPTMGLILTIFGLQLGIVGIVLYHKFCGR